MKGWELRDEVEEVNRARIYITKALNSHVMEFGSYLNENKKSLAKKWHIQTDTLNGSLWLPKGE